MPPPHTPDWFDAHLDLAFLAETGRDMHVDPHRARGRFQPAAVTLPALATGRVRAVLATVFTEAITDPAPHNAETGAFAYPFDDADRAYVAGMRQLKLYHAWRDAGLISLPAAVDTPDSPQRPPQHGESSTGRARSAEAAEDDQHLEPSAGSETRPLSVGVLVENADPISTPDDLPTWRDAGVVAIGLTWTTRGRYASGNAVPSDEPGSGLTPRGRDFVARMDELGLVHDASHLNDRSLAELFEATDRAVVATHSNCRALLGGSDQRHLDDQSIREIARRGGVIGLNLFSPFLTRSPGKSGRATLEECADHVEHACEIIGNREHVGLGSDMDGGFTAARLPEGIDSPADLQSLVQVLSNRGWSDNDLAGFMHKNWARVFPDLLTPTCAHRA